MPFLNLFSTGLDDSIFPYSHFFINNNVTGRGLLNITVDDLYKLHVEKMGHQEIILEGLEHLKNLVSCEMRQIPAYHPQFTYHIFQFCIVTYVFFSSTTTSTPRTCSTSV